VDEAPPRAALAVIRGVVALVESLKIGFTALGISANEQLEEDEEPISSGMWVGTVVAALALAIGLFFVVPGRADLDLQGQAGLGVPVLGRRGRAAARRSSSATCGCSRAWRTCGACSSTTAPSTRRSPASRPASR
jgi:hypothetical protein